VNRRKIRVVERCSSVSPGRYLITQPLRRRPRCRCCGSSGGRVHENESDPNALKRELHERLGLDVVVDEEAMATQPRGTTPTRSSFRVFRCHLARPDQECQSRQGERSPLGGAGRDGRISVPRRRRREHWPSCSTWILTMHQFPKTSGGIESHLRFHVSRARPRS